MWIQIFHVNQHDREAALHDAVRKAAERHTGSEECVKFGRPALGPPDIAIYLGSPAGALDAGSERELIEVVKRNGLVLPIVSDLDHYREETPQILHSINGVQWSRGEEIAELVLRRLGLAESDRRVFLSYRRLESTPLADQLEEALNRKRYKVFLDRYDVEAGEYVQARIYEALQEMSFVLLLESPQVRSSRWVEEEIGYALEYELGLLSLSLPGVSERPPFEMVPEDKRERLSEGDRENEGRLTPEALRRVLLRIDREHADQLRARRERLIQDIAEVLRDAGRPCRRLGPSSLIRQGSNTSTIIRVCPRPPAPNDLYAIGQEREARMYTPDAWMVGVRTGYHEERAVTHWIASSLARPVRWLVPSEVRDEATIRLD